jgi:hypothetical protein
MGDIKIVYFGPKKEYEDNRYITDWEKMMKSSIDQIVDGEEASKREVETQVSEIPRIIHCNFLEINNRKKEYEEKYRINYTLSLLKRCGLNIDKFKKTRMFKAGGLSLLSCIQDKIDGFNYDENTNRVPNGHVMNIDETKCVYKEGHLYLMDEAVLYDFRVDSHKIVYVNGENVLNSSGVLTSKEIKEVEDSLQDLHDDMKSDRLRHEKSMQKSLDEASKWRNDF